MPEPTAPAQQPTDPTPNTPPNPTLVSNPPPDPQTPPEPQGTPAPAAQPEGPSWRDQLDAELRQNASLQGFESVNDLAKAAIQQQYTAHVPQRPEEYNIPEGAPDQIRQFAQSHQLTQYQLDGMLRMAAEMQGATEQMANAELQKGIQELKTEWGDQFDSNVKVAQLVLRTFDTEDKAVAKMLTDTRAGDNPVVIRFLNTIGEALVEDGFLESEHRPTKKAQDAASVMYPDQGKTE